MTFALVELERLDYVSICALLQKVVKTFVLHQKIGQNEE